VPNDISLLDEVSPAIQDYVKALYMLAGEGSERPVPTTAVAERLGVSAASATKMLKRLDALGLASHESYRGAALTPAGVKIALEVIRHHRLLETYLAEALGVPWDEVHQEAEVLEHVLSEGLEDRIAALLGDPALDPHGHPIPGKDGSLPAVATKTLWACADGETARVGRVSDEEPSALRYLGDAGIRPGTSVKVIERGPIGGPLFVRVGSRRETTALSKELSEAVWVD
jgi:DtxR family transcriptional regulator, Mn-dependent transcriptional regulator